MESTFKISWSIFALTVAATSAALFVIPGRPLILIWVPISILIGLAAAYASRRANPDMRVTQFRNVVLAGSTIAKALIVALLIAVTLVPMLKPFLPKVVMAIGGLLIVIAGNYLPKTARNDARNLPQPWNFLFSIPWALPLSYMFGVRTWWTLKNDRVWNYTQRFAGRVWILGGIGYLAIPWLFAGREIFYAMLADLGIMILLPILYSWLVSEPGEASVAA